MSEVRTISLNYLKSQFQKLRSDPLINAGVSVGLIHDDYYHWRFTLRGPDDTPYKDGLFCLEMIFPETFPVDKPEVKFITPIYHLNIKHTINGSEPLGHICLSSLNWWNPQTSVKQLILEIFALFYLANPGSPYGMDRMQLYNTNRQEYERLARKFTKKYAGFSSAPYDASNGWDFS